MTNNLLNVRQLSAYYGQKKILDQIDFQLQEGEIVALLGLNGSGKTTLLKALLANVKVDAQITFQGKDLNQLSVKQKAQCIAYLPQRTLLTFSISVKEVMEMGFHSQLSFLSNCGKNEHRKLKEIAHQFNVTHLLEDDFLTLSEGMKQRVLLARTLLQNAPLFLLDEPDSAMDYPTRNEMLKQLQTIIKEQQKCCLITLHDPNYALTYCDRIYLMESGKLIEMIDLHCESLEEISMKLTKIYPNTKVIEHESRLYMVEKL